MDFYYDKFQVNLSRVTDTETLDSLHHFYNELEVFAHVYERQVTQDVESGSVN